MKTIKLTLCCVLLAVGCTADSPSEVEPTRDEARRLTEDDSGNKADHFGDICDYWGWYEDDVCDEFCPRPDPDCSGSCRADDDCFQVQCLVAPCPETICIDGACTIDTVGDSCDAGMRECDVCGDVTCIPADNRCITTAVLCPPPNRCNVGEQECQTCGDSFVCAPNPGACPAVTCPPPSGCAEGEQECQTCGDSFVCAPDAVSCPLVTCPPPSRCAEGEQECQTCGDSFVCSPDSVSCPLVQCPPPSRCAEGEQECQTCGDSFVCTPNPGVCPAVQCPPDTLCTETCEYSADGDCDDGGAGADYSLCELGSDCTDCGAR